MHVTPAASTPLLPQTTALATPTTAVTLNPTPTNPAAPPNDPVPPSTTDPVNPTVSQPPDRARGMLRNLASGHFRGVADLRHRLNFAAEIKAAGLTLPDPTPPKGNGKAYAKFLAAYRSSQPQPPSGPPAAEAVDQVA